MNWVDYRERLGIGFDDKSKLDMCMNRINHIAKELEMYYGIDHLEVYMYTVGEDIERFNGISSDSLKYALNSVNRSKTLKEFISKYVALINSAMDRMKAPNDDQHLSKVMEDILTSTLEFYRIPYDIIHDNDGVFIFPKGVPEFDKDLVSDTLLWLIRYPETEKAWGNALRAYSLGEEPSEVADKFRKALERFFQNFFCSESTLENMKSDYGRYLKAHGISGEMVGNLEGVIQQYTNFMNNHAKHHDRTNTLLLEYLMYQTGNIIRLLIKLSEEEQEENENT